MAKVSVPRTMRSMTTSTATGRRDVPAALLAKVEAWATADPHVLEPAQIVLTHGVASAAASLAPVDLRGPLGECYANGQAAARALRDAAAPARYCEGYAYHSKYKIAYQHGWLLTESGQVLETTWTDTAGIAYLGVPFGLAELDELTQMAPGSLLFGDHKRDFVLNRRHHPCCLTPPEHSCQVADGG